MNRSHPVVDAVNRAAPPVVADLKEQNPAATGWFALVIPDDDETGHPAWVRCHCSIHQRL